MKIQIKTIRYADGCVYANLICDLLKKDEKEVMDGLSKFIAQAVLNGLNVTVEHLE